MTHTLTFSFTSQVSPKYILPLIRSFAVPSGLQNCNIIIRDNLSCLSCWHKTLELCDVEIIHLPTFRLCVLILLYLLSNILTACSAESLLTSVHLVSPHFTSIGDHGKTTYKQHYIPDILRSVAIFCLHFRCFIICSY